MKLVAFVFLVTWLTQSGVSLADDDNDTAVNPSTNGLTVGVESNVSLTEEQDGTESNTVVQTYTENGMAEGFCAGTNWTASCLPDDEDGQEIDGQLVAQAFQFVPLPPSTMIVQPPNGRTLVNFETNFYTDAPEVLPFSVPILDQVVELRVWPAEFLWRFGDGGELRTTERGAAYPELGITHAYLDKGQVAPELDTTYAAEWRLQGAQQWQPVPGTVTIEGAPTTLEVVSATPMLVG